MGCGAHRFIIGQAVLGMFGYMTELDSVSIDDSMTCEFEVSGHDYETLLFALLDEFLFRFCVDDCMVCREINILEFDTTNWRIKVQG